MNSLNSAGHGVSNAVLGVIAGIGALAGLALLVYAVAAVGSGGSSTDDATAADLYISLGDSVAAGNGASDPAATSYAALIAASREVTLFNIARAGADTQAVISDQLPQALPLLGGGRVAFITIAAGGNDLAPLIPNPDCTQDPAPESCPLDVTLDGVAARIGETLRLLREADAQVPIVLLGYPNFFAGTGHTWEGAAGVVLLMLTDTLQDVAGKYEGVSVATPSFAEQSINNALTHVREDPFDPHPNDAGHRIISDAIDAGLERIEQQ